MINQKKATLKVSGIDIEGLENIGLPEITNEVEVELKKSPEDMVNHPEHYDLKGLEVIEVIKKTMTYSDFTAYCHGNVIKYVLRCRKKGGIQDLKKAKVYINYMLEAYKESYMCDGEAPYFWEDAKGGES